MCLYSAQTNVALTSKGSQCEASQPECQRAFDGYGVSSNTIHRWAFFAEAKWNWIKVTFNQPYTIYTVRFMQLAFAEESNFKNLALSFDGNSQKLVILYLYITKVKVGVNDPVGVQYLKIFVYLQGPGGTKSTIRYFQILDICKGNNLFKLYSFLTLQFL